MAEILTPEYIAALRDAVGKIADPINEYLLTEIARRISEAGQLTSTAAYEVWISQSLDQSQREIKKRLKELLRKSDKEIEELLTQSAEVGYRFDLERLPTAEAIPFEENTALQKMVAAAVKLAQDDFSNLVQTRGFVAPDGKAYPLTQAYKRACDFAFMQTFTGAADYSTAIRNACKGLAERGIVTIDYKSGISTSLEAAVRRNVFSGLGLMQEQISQYNFDALGADGVEISAHANSAPDHEFLQGRQYEAKEFERLNNSLVRRIGTLNCGHASFPIIMGINAPQYTPEELQQFRADNEKGVSIDGRHYTGYQATQMQRKLERTIRKQERAVLVAETTCDVEKVPMLKTKLQILRQEYKRFSGAAGLRTEDERLYVAGFGRKEAGRARTAAKPQKSTVSIASKDVEILSKHGKISAEEKNGVVEVKEVGRIDINKYRVVTDQIRTDEVIITDERIQHIKDRHPNDFERYAQYLQDIVENPQYILEDKTPNMAVLLKEYVEDEKRFRLILRLSIPSDPADYKNSIITFLEISERKFQKYLRNKKILYKSE